MKNPIQMDDEVGDPYFRNLHMDMRVSQHTLANMMKICLRWMKMHQLNTMVFLLKLHRWNGEPYDSGTIKTCHVPKKIM